MVSAHGYVDPKPNVNLPDTGGQTIYVVELAKALAQKGHQVDILTRRFDDRPAVQEIAEGTRIIRLEDGVSNFVPRADTYLQMDNLAQHFHEWCRKNKQTYDVVHTHYWDAGIFAMILRNHYNWKSIHVHTPHSLGLRTLGAFGDDSYGTVQYRTECERSLYGCSDLVIATSSDQAEHLRGPTYEVGRERIRVIPPGYDDSLFFPAPGQWRDSLRADRGWTTPIVFAAGRLDRCKGYDLLVQAMRYVWERHSEAKLYIAAGRRRDNAGVDEFRGALRRDYLDIVGPAHRDRLILSSGLPQHKLVDAYRAADVFALSSRYEAFGMTAIEAMACGTPTVVTTASGMREQLDWGDQCIYANPHDAAEFGLAISNLLTYNEARERLRTHGAICARTLYTWAKIADRMEDLYNGFFVAE